MEESLLERQPGCIVRGVKNLTFLSNHEWVKAEYVTDNGGAGAVKACLMLACDGKDSYIRDCLHIPFNGKYYPDNYVMGDFHDSTSFGRKAVIFLCKEGVIESFPLPFKLRRWVVKTDQFHPELPAKDLTDLIQKRTGVYVDPSSVSMLNGFQTQGLIAKRFYTDRILLAGDAAHVTSPIGGQGMNMGWLNAWRLADAVHRLLKNGADREAVFKMYEQRSKRITREVIRRAEMNMFLGRKWPFQFLRRLIIHFMLDTPVRYVFTNVFTMRWL